jgi:hypothetical protein
VVLLIGLDDLKNSSVLFCELSRPQDKSFSPVGQVAVKMFVDVTAAASNSVIGM